MLYLLHSADSERFAAHGNGAARYGDRMTNLATAITDCANDTWDTIVPVMHEYIAIPNVSLAFDPDWRANGHMAEAVTLIADWCRARPIDGLTVDVIELDGRTPIILMEVPATGAGTNDDTVLLYGHLDKQPEMEGWRDGLGPWTPVLEGDRLYGRGSADDGYAVVRQPHRHPGRAGSGRLAQPLRGAHRVERGVGHPDLPFYVEALADRIGTPSLVICLDSGCIDYDRLWVTTSLRGLVSGTLKVDIVTEGLHSGDVAGHDPVDVPDRPHAARPGRGRRDRERSSCPNSRRHPRGPAAARPTRRPPRSARSPTTIRSSTAPGRPPTTRPSSCCAPHLAADAQRRRRRGSAAHRAGGQRAAARARR